jgi:signal transduction histidine kinase
VGNRIVAPISALVFVLVGALAVGGFLAVRQSVASQESTNLSSDASQLALVLQVAIQQITAQLKPVAALTAATNYSPATFEDDAKSATSSPGESVAIVSTTGDKAVVKLAAGPDLKVGGALPPTLAAIVARAGPTTLGTHEFGLDGKRALGFAIGPPYTAAGTAIVQTNVFHPSLPAKNVSGPYKGLDVAIYVAPTASPGELLASTVGLRPLAPPVHRTFLTITNNKWLVLVSAKGPLVGSLLRDSPWIVLLAGLLLALFVAATTQVQARRKIYAEALATERAAELMASQTELMRAERLAAIGELTTVVGHELRNPLGASTNALFLARQRLGADIDGQVDRHLSMVESQIGRAVKLCEDLTAYVRRRDPEHVELVLRDVIDEAIRSTPAPPGIEVTVDAASVEVNADASMLHRVITNLVTNAYQAMPEGGSLHIGSCSNEDFDVITLQDSGQGVDDEVAARLFDPFYTTKAEGTGLGLAIVHQIIEAHQGEISIGNAADGGAVVTIRLPRATNGNRP